MASTRYNRTILELKYLNLCNLHIKCHGLQSHYIRIEILPKIRLFFSETRYNRTILELK